ncbi:MAG: DUF3139 domain-containing protein [Paraclostridium sp.]
MKKYISILLIIVTVAIGFFVYDNYFAPYNWDEAEESINRYIKDQGILTSNINTITKEKDTNMKGINYIITYKDDPQYEYHYLYQEDMYDKYSYKVALRVYDLSQVNERVRGDDIKNIKYIPIYLIKK